jgi:hypothetical protein
MREEFMSYHPDEHGSGRRAQGKTPWIVAAIIIMLLVTWVIMRTNDRLSQIPDINGSITIEADPETRIYIGDQLVGTGRATCTCAELFGDEEHLPLAIELPLPVGTISPELISGPGAKLLEKDFIMGSQSDGLRDWADRYLIRRSDGSLDHVMIIGHEFKRSNEPPWAYVILLRLRKGAKPSTTYFTHNSAQSTMDSKPSFIKLLGRSPTVMDELWRFGPQARPDKFDDEIKTKGLWEPGEAK